MTGISQEMEAVQEEGADLIYNWKQQATTSMSESGGSGVGAGTGRRGGATPGLHRGT